MKIKTLLIFIGIILLLAAGGAYWYFFLQNPAPSLTDTGSNSQSTGFTPFGRPSTGTTQTPTGNTSATSTPAPVVAKPIPTLRLLSSTPIGGYGASTTASTTIVRWVDRGRGNVYEAHENSLDITTLSNTVLPRMYTSVWNKNLTAFIGSLLQDGKEAPSTVRASLVPQAQASTSSITPYALKGSALPDNIIGYADSPKMDKVFMLMDLGGYAGGYVASVDGSGMKQIFTTPLTQLNVDWPSDNVIALTTKGSADEGGFLYFVDPKTGSWTKVLGPLPGLSAKVSRDAKYAVISAAGDSNNVLTSIYNIQKKTGIDAAIRTIADKCVWGNFYKNLVYCGVPSQQISGVYPDDWYKGTISFTDKIWQVNADTGEVHLISTIVDQSDRIIDSFNFGLDPKDNYLFFMNKNDLSFWSLDLVKGQ